MTGTRTVDDQQAMEHDNELRALDANARKIHDDKDRKLARMAQFTAVKQGVAQGSTDTMEAAKRRQEQSRKVDDHVRSIESIQVALDEMNARFDKIELKFSDIDFRQRELDAYAKDCNKTWHDTMESKFYTMTCSLQAEVDNRTRMGQEFQQMLRLREQKFKQAFLNELNEESNARMAVSNDVSKLTEEFRDLRAACDDESSKTAAKVASTSAKLKALITDLSDQLSTERLMRERADTACKSDCETKVKDLRCILDSKMLQIDEEQGVDIDFLKNESVLIQNQINATKSFCIDLIEDLDAKRAKLAHDEVVNMGLKVDDVAKRFDEGIKSFGKTRDEFRAEIRANADDAKRATRTIESDMAKEHLRREQDEANIVNMLETFMKQIKMMNTSAA